MRPVSFLPFAIALATALPAAAGPLIDADSLETRLQDSDLAIIDIRNDIDGGSLETFAKGHVPGAVYSNYLQDPAKAKEKFELARKQTNDNELVAELDRYIDEAQRSIEIRERTEKLRQMREQAAKEREAKEAAEKAAQGSGGGDEGGGAPPDEGGSDGDDSGGDEGTGGDEAPAPSEDGGAGGGSPEAGDDAPAE